MTEDEERWIDRVIDNRYRVVEHIGRGGMGTVYKVVHTQMGKIAALKLMHGSLASNSELVLRFHREAEAISKLSHPNIVQVFDFGRIEDSFYLVMEYLKGEDLATILRRDGRVDIGRAVPILVQICDALTEAHALGVIHRDLKPENVRVARTHEGLDFIKVMDFGLAKMLRQTDPGITSRGNLVGTPYYMAPEAIRGHAVDHRADIYSLGAVAYRMLTGENAFTAQSPVGVLTKHITEDLLPPSQRVRELSFPSRLDDIVTRAMAKDPAARYQSAAEMKRDLVELLGPAPARVLPAGSTPWTNEPLAVDGSAGEDLAFERRLRRGWLTKALIALAALLAVGAGLYWFMLRPDRLYAPPQEIEPNNRPELATLIASGQPIEGHLGQRVSATESDRDWYKLQVAGSGSQIVQARLSAIPNMNTTLELYDAAAGRIAHADSTGVGGGEVITNWPVDPGHCYLLVREVWAVDVPPTENVTDAYVLKVTYRPHTPDWELEPNDAPHQANELRAGSTLRGFFGSPTDQDIVAIRASAGRLAGAVSGLPGVDIVLEIAGKTIDKAGSSGGERFSGVPTDGKQPVLLTLRQQRSTKGTSSTSGTSPPYVLMVWLAE